MAGNQAQKETTPEGELFGAVSGFALIFAPDLDLAPLNAEEGIIAHAARLLTAMEPLAKDLQEARDAIESDRDAIASELAAVKRQLAAQKGSATKARAMVEELKSRGKPRALGPLDKPLSAVDLLALIDDADVVELAFSDGKTEIPGLAPRSVSGDAWHIRNGKLVLNVPSLLVHGPGVGAPDYTLCGYALLLDGELAAFAPRPSLTIGGGSKYELREDVTFG